MYQTYFGLRDHPFSITPDPGYLYLSSAHQEALAHLLYGTHEDGGFVQLTGEVGTGKTTLIRSLLAQHLENIDVALCLNPKLTVQEFVASICDELKVDYPSQSQSLKPLIDALNKHLLETHAQGRQTVLIIDEAQNLSRDVLEQVRLFTNLETHRHKLLKIILVGQPELQQLLERADLRQLAQRITARYHLPSLNRQETIAYIDHRLSVAGSRASRLFSRAALNLIYRRSSGVPRLINVICDRALLGAYVRGKQAVDWTILNQAAREVLPEKISRPSYSSPPWWTLASALAVALAVGLGIRPASLEQTPQVAVSDTATVLTEAEEQNEIDNIEVTPESESEPESEPDTVETAIASENNIGQVAVSETSQSGAIPAVASATTLTPASETPAASDVAVNKPANQVVNLVALLESAPQSSQAMTQLLHLWGENMNVTAGVYPCEALKSRNLHCLSGQTDWSTLRNYNRPAVLHLIGVNGQTRQVLLSALQQEEAAIDLGQGPVTVTLDQLDPLWTGEYLLLWRPPIKQSLIGPDSRGDEVIWLRRQLTFAESGVLPSGALSDRFDTKLEQMVRRFQQQNQLEVDGLVGAKTLLLINNIAPSQDTPLLNSAALGKV